MALTRRSFLGSAGLGLLALGLPPSFLVRAARGKRHKSGRVLVVIFQRGGMDGLNAVVPFGEPSYYSTRPTLAVPAPGRGQERSVDLDGFYALHPALAPLKAVFDAGHLAIVQAVGSPDNTRSHFDAQDAIELGTPGVRTTPDGWLNRALDEPAGEKSPLRAVALGSRPSLILNGGAPALTIDSLDRFRLHDRSMAGGLQEIYTRSGDVLLRRSGVGLFQAMEQLKRIGSGSPSRQQGYPRGRFGADLKSIARLIKAEVGLEIGFAEIKGWDTHVNQGGASGPMADRLRELAQGLVAFWRDLGDRMEEVLLLTLSEFGRTVRENGNRGTDHGHANAMFVLGGRVRGGKVYGRWPGLEPEQLYEGRDLALGTDFREVCGEVLARHLGQRDLSRVFPGYGSPVRPLSIIT